MPPLISIADIPDLIGKTWTSQWVDIPQERIDAFAEATDDHQFIHVDPEAASETIFGGTVAHGFLTLSMLSVMHNDCVPKTREQTMGINYGFNRVRFMNAVPAGARIRGLFTLSAGRQRGPNLFHLTFEVTVEIENVDKPAMTAIWLTLFQFDPEMVAAAE